MIAEQAGPELFELVERIRRRTIALRRGGSETAADAPDGPDALGEARVLCEIDGRQFTGQGVSPDVLEASAIAYIRAVTASRNADVTERMAERGV